MRLVTDFWMRWCVEAGGVGTKLRPKASTSVSIGDSWWEERFLMALFLKLARSCWGIRCLVLLKFLVVCISGKSFLNEGLEYGRLSHNVIAKFSEPSLRVVLIYV